MQHWSAVQTKRDRRERTLTRAATWVYLGAFFFTTVTLGATRAISLRARPVEIVLLSAVALVVFITGVPKRHAVRTIVALNLFAAAVLVHFLTRPQIEWFGSPNAYLGSVVLFILTYGLTIIYTGTLFNREHFIEVFIKISRFSLIVALIAYAAWQLVGTDLLVSRRLDTGVARIQGTLDEPSSFAPVLAGLFLLTFARRDRMTRRGRRRTWVLVAAGVALAKSPTVLMVFGMSVILYMLLATKWSTKKPFVVVLSVFLTVGGYWFVETADPEAWTEAGGVSQTVGRLLTGIENVRSGGEVGKNDRYASTETTFRELDALGVGDTGAGADAHAVFFPEKYPAPEGAVKGVSPNALWVTVAFNFGRPAMLALLALMTLAVFRMRRDLELLAILMPFLLSALVNSAGGVELYKFTFLAVLLFTFGWRKSTVKEPPAEPRAEKPRRPRRWPPPSSVPPRLPVGVGRR